MNELKWVAEARKYIGTKEIKGVKHNPVILGLWKSAFDATNQATPAVFKNDETAWCGGFVAGVLAKANLGKHIPKSFAMAKAWLNAGTKLDRPAYGCVVVFWRGTPNPPAVMWALWWGVIEKAILWYLAAISLTRSISCHLIKSVFWVIVGAVQCQALQSIDTTCHF